MLPLQQAYEVKHSILEYLKATFSFKDKRVHDAFYNLINNTEEGIFKGPYVSLKLPFVKANESQIIPLDIKPGFPPYDHQYKAFQRLSTASAHKPQATLITTGTSSGKTECFLYPILDYCYKNLHRSGIKVIILYPMNALATDQAKRLAEAIWADSRIRGKVTAGLFIGEGKDKKKYPKEMGEKHVIENRDSIVDSPPDILLTNFKMLDYALMRHNFHNLWNFNLEDTDLLQFLVLDELHTYDGAQGTDVANLIRRLKLKLNIPKGQICPIGTSATIGAGEESKILLTNYAEKVFGESFDENSIIVENRLPVNEFFTLSEDALDKFIPRQMGLLESRLGENETYADYIRRQKRLWQLSESLDETKLGTELLKLKLVKDLVSLTSKNIKSLDDLLRELADINPEFKRLPEWDEENELSPREEVINSLLALISEAKSGNEKKFPFLYLQIQVWIRELSGVLREVNEHPLFTWKDKVGDKYEPKALPAYFCRECGASGWLGVKDDNKNHFTSEPNLIYEYYFAHHKNVYLINTPDHRHIEEYEPTNTIDDFLHPVDLTLLEKGGKEAFKIHAVRKLTDSRSRHVCPECNTENTLNIIGTRIATLSSITVSQVLASDLDPRTDKYRKILAFTNSVQDAAHQAGFVEARNYRFTFRASLQKVINEKGPILNLAQLQEEFINYWKTNSDESGQNPEQAYYYRFFPADYKAKADINTDYRVGNNFTTAFKNEFDERMRWETSIEFGHNALLGRTLEKSGASAVKFDEQKVVAVFPAIKEWLMQNNLGTITEEIFLPFINGILHRVRTRGGVDHEYLSKFRNNGLQLWDLNWNSDNRHFLNKYFGKKSRFPRLVTTEAHGRGLLDSTFTNSNNWYRYYFIKSFQMASHHHAIVNEFYQKLFEVFVEVGIMNKGGKDDYFNYAIVPSVIQVENKVRKYECDVCASTISVAESDRLTALTNCLDYTCRTGSYKATPKAKPNYYQLVYNRNRSPRIYAAEHTGILERKDREQKEFDFKERPNFNSLNTIVATSTLEMGIDIGTLNTAINNSVPPLTSNFLQRVGRAGRSSGSALITNFAQSKAHDLFYYEEPLDMMEGEISTPGCYLEAKDILFRHFFAYCLDNWSSENPRNNAIPGRIISLRLLNTDLNSSEFLCNRIISFIKAHESKLLNRFIDFYKPDLGEDGKVLDNLRAVMADNTFYTRIKSVFDKLKKEYEYIHAKRKEIDDIIKSNNLPETDEERKALEGEKKALWGLKRLIDKRSILEHLTNVGLLPNYAFPETGVTLNAWVKSNKAKASDSIPTDKQFEIVRSSSVAIREFAPDNHFYSQGHKFAVSGLNTFDWKDPGTLLVKRFCSNCDHIEDSAVSNEASCPKCGDSSWSSAKNKHTFVKISGVKSVNTRENSTLDDSSDERTANLYTVSKHLKFDYKTFQGAWGMKDIPFGIEYVKNVDITEVNLGLSSSADANKITINQHEEIPYHGFVTCKHCGKSTSNPHQIRYVRNFKFHYGYCKHKDKEYLGKSDEVFEEVYLFKEIKTEALKVLLPVQDLESESQVNMFKAGLELGLKKYYKGNPQHLSFINYSEFNAKNGRFDRYLVVYDNIPGGTGYLEKLFNPVEFTDVITKAYHAIRDCGCQYKGKDGCYRCIFTYSNQHIQDELSRAWAERLFKKIVDKSSAWENYTSSLGSLSGNGQIEESELEERFIRSLKNYLLAKGDEGYKFEEFIQDSVLNYKFKLTNGEYSFSYVIRPQFELGPAEGVKYKTRTDFYITLVSIEKNGILINDEAVFSFVKNIAIYLDGYTFHATKDNNRFANDLQKRMAIVESGDKLTWTLSWTDIEKFDAIEKESDAESKQFKRDNLFLERSKFRNTISKYEAIPYWKQYKSSLFDTKNSMDRLLWLLSNPIEIMKRQQKVGLFLSLFQSNFATPSVDEVDIDKVLGSPNQIDSSIQAKIKSQGKFYTFPEVFDNTNFGNIKTGVKVLDLEIKAALWIKTVSDNLEKDKWENFWQVYNVIQEHAVLYNEVSQSPVDNSEMESDKYECLKYHDVSIHSIVKQLIDSKIPFNLDGGFFLEHNGIFAEAMLGFESAKIFIGPQSEADAKMFIEAGYKEVKASDFNIKMIQ
ncbi:MAG: DEAD/DEAH box helicase [Bacteroidetes bacterium]|nr:DEAD/DEAH box helicase [Bacteroidota bacterium]